ncbi:MAG: hypothetical protein AAF479_17020, partial [Pseudomonadota bacterium]
QTVDVNEWVKLSDVVQIDDPDDGDLQFEIGVFDNFGSDSWWADGEFVDAASGAGYTTENLNGVWFRGDDVAGSQTLWVRAHDGEGWSEWDSFELITLANEAPVVTIANQTLGKGVWEELSDVISVFDQEGDTIQKYELWDSDGSNSWWADGGYVDAQTGYITSDLSDVRFQGDVTSGSQTLWVRAFDENTWGEWHSFELVTTNEAPDVEIGDQTVAADEFVFLGDVMNVTDDDPIVHFELYDDAGTSSWYLDGIAIDASASYHVDAAVLDQIEFRGDEEPGAQTIAVRAYDGETWGEWETFDLTTV